MKKFSRVEIDDWREVFTSRGYDKKVAELDSRRIDYFVMPRDIFGEIPNGLFRMTGAPDDGYLVGVSEQVPEIVQPHFAVSEHDEFMVYGLDDLDKTLHSEENMLRIIGDDRSVGPVYVEKKLALYDYMLRIAKGDLGTWGFTEADYVGFQRAVEFLRTKE